MASARVRRREFISLAGAALTWPMVARAQHSAQLRRVGVLTGYAENDPEGQAVVEAFRQGLRALGWIEDRNVRIEVRWAAAADPALLRINAAQLVELNADVILVNGTRAVAAIQRESSAVQIVFAAIYDPVRSGIVESLARPGGNVTGFTTFEGSPTGKLLELLKEAAPEISRVALAFDPDNASSTDQWRQFEKQALSFNVTPIAVPGHNPLEFEQTIDAFAREPSGGLMVMTDVTLLTFRDLLVGLAMKHRLPAVYASRPFVVAGGLMSYGADRSDLYRRAAAYVDRILKGERSRNLPVQQPTKFELVINLKTAKALGLTVPLTLQAAANEVIE